MRKSLILVLGLTIILGCGFIKTAKDDYNTNVNTPLRAGEVSPQEQTKSLVDSLAGIPYVGMSAPFILLLGPAFFGWLRGRRLRREKLGALTVTGEPTMTDMLLQILNDIRLGVFEFGPDGSSLKRGWKMAVLGIIASALAPEISKLIIPFITHHHPAWVNDTMIATIVGVLAGLEKKLSKSAVTPPLPG